MSESNIRFEKFFPFFFSSRRWPSVCGRSEFFPLHFFFRFPLFLHRTQSPGRQSCCFLGGERRREKRRPALSPSQRWRVLAAERGSSREALSLAEHRRRTNRRRRRLASPLPLLLLPRRRSELQHLQQQQEEAVALAPLAAALRGVWRLAGRRQQQRRPLRHSLSALRRCRRRRP